MEMPKMSLLAWQKKYGTEKACAKALYKVRWPDGFYCPRCGCKKPSYITTRKMHQCSQCKYHVSLTTGTLFDSTNLPSVKWFWTIYLVAADKGGISALRLAKFSRYRNDCWVKNESGFCSGSHAVFETQ